MRDPLIVLQQYFGHESFRPHQREIVDAALDGKDLLALLPTGGGKSVCYQIPGLCTQGITIVISPLVALIKDQVKQLNNKGIKAVGITSGIAYRELDDILDNCIYGNFKFLYLSPERLQQDLVQERISKMDVNYIAIDEAHCISQWGHDFRPAYLKIAGLKDLHPSTPIIAVTATATREVQKDIVHQLKMPNAQVFSSSFERSNISYLSSHTADKNKALLDALRPANGSAIVYVRTRKNAALTADFLNRNQKPATFYHGGLDNRTREKNAAEWMTGARQVMVATSAFGMGIDKPDVRQVIHLQLPESLESYYQETGRAGRDGLPSIAHFIFNGNDIERSYNHYINSQADVEFVKLLYRKLCNFLQIALGEGQDDVYPFSFVDFCKRHDLQALRVYAGLQVLERFGILELGQGVQRGSRVRFRESAERINQFTKNRPKEHAVIQAILRSYGSSRHQSIKLDDKIIAIRSGTTTRDVQQTLLQLQKYNLAEVDLSSGDMTIKLLQPRDDDRTIIPFQKEIAFQLKVKRQKLKKVVQYVYERDKCLNNVLLDYFDEHKQSRCGQCSNCLRIESSTIDTLEDRLLEILQHGPISLEGLSSSCGIHGSELLSSLRTLLDTKRIQTTPDFKYRLHE